MVPRFTPSIDHYMTRMNRIDVKGSATRVPAAIADPGTHNTSARRAAAILAYSDPATHRVIQEGKAFLPGTVGAESHTQRNAMTYPMVPGDPLTAPSKRFRGPANFVRRSAVDSANGPGRANEQASPSCIVL